MIFSSATSSEPVQPADASSGVSGVGPDTGRYDMVGCACAEIEGALLDPTTESDEWKEQTAKHEREERQRAAPRPRPRAGSRSAGSLLGWAAWAGWRSSRWLRLSALDRMRWRGEKAKNQR